MSHARFMVGDVFEQMGKLPDGSVDLVLTSPPFLALRSYLPADHPDKDREIGSEPDPAAFLDTLLHLTAEWGRLLAPHGSIAVELGDTYSGSTGGGGDYTVRDVAEGERATRREGFIANGIVPNTASRKGVGWPLAKSLCGIPHLYHLSLAYGRNLLTGETSPAGMWRVRNVVAWCRPNPPVGALGDKYRPATSYMTVACRGPSRWFDLDAVRTEHKADNVGTFPGRESYPLEAGPRANGKAAISGQNPAGAPPLDWWEIPTQPYAGAHYATWPTALCERPVKSMCPRRVCTVCGTPSTRIVDADEWPRSEYKARRTPMAHERGGAGTLAELVNDGGRARDRNVSTVDRRTLGWTDCGHDQWRNGLVLDPFAGSGTTLAVATGHGRDAIGIDLDARNADLARQRVGMFLDVDEEGAA